MNYQYDEMLRYGEINLSLVIGETVGSGFTNNTHTHKKK